MRTGDGEVDISEFMVAGEKLLQPVMEAAIVLAAHYTECCKRTCVSMQDLELGLMYAAQTVLGRSGPLYPEAWDGDSEEDEDASEDSNEEWQAYEGPDDMCQKMNASKTTWDEWIPDSPAGVALKNAVNDVRQKIAGHT